MMIGHSTVLIEGAGKRTITDPCFGTWGHLAYRRLAPPALERDQLTDVDLVLLSHNHWDHVDGRYLRSLPTTTPVLAPLWTSQTVEGFVRRLKEAGLEAETVVLSEGESWQL